MKYFNRSVLFSLIIVFLFVLNGCKGLTCFQASNSLYGTWIKKGYQDSITVMEKAEKLDKSNYGFIIQRNGTFTERKNSGWCGTPPISYANYDGTWKYISDELLEIEVGFWGGKTTFQIEIILQTRNELHIKYRYLD